MSKVKDREHVEVTGWFQPHRPVDFDNSYVDLKTGEIAYYPSMTKQSEMAACDINNIIKEFAVTGIAKHISERRELYTDLPDPVDYQQALNLAFDAQKAFAELPAKVRARFDNDPAHFLDFMSDPANQQEMIDLGLATDNRPPQDPPKDPPQDPSSDPK